MSCIARLPDALGVGRRTVLWTAVVAAVAMPLMLGVLQAPSLLAQTQTAEPVPAFEVASVKPNKSGERTGPYFRDEGLQRVVVNNNLFTIIRGAWGLPPDQILGGPDWLRSERERFDILAKAPDGTTRPQMQLMARTLLADRFKLKTHVEPRPSAVEQRRASLRPAVIDRQYPRASPDRGPGPRACLPQRPRTSRRRSVRPGCRL